MIHVDDSTGCVANPPGEMVGEPTPIRIPLAKLKCISPRRLQDLPPGGGGRSRAARHCRVGSRTLLKKLSFLETFLREEEIPLPLADDVPETETV